MSHHYAKAPAYEQDQDYDNSDSGQRQPHQSFPSAAAGFSGGPPPAWTTIATTTTSVSPIDLYPQTTTTTATTYALSEVQGREDDNTHQLQQQQMFTVPMTPPSNSSAPQDTEHDGGAPSSSNPSSSSSATTHQGSSSSAAGPGRLQPTRSSTRPSTAVDGVFSNISAKPEVEVQKDDERRPPTYESALQDVTPPYFEMTVMSPSSQHGGRRDSVFEDEILVGGLPVGNIFQFLWNIAVAGSFQFLGVLLTYLLHNSHASKSGSLAGLGITLLNFGIRMRGGLGTIFNNDTSTNNPNPSTYAYNPSIGGVTQISNPSLPSVDDTGYIGTPPPLGYGYEANADSREMNWFQMDLETHWVSMVLIMAGWMVLVKALAEYAIAKRMESIIKARPENEDLEDGGMEDEEEDEEEMEEFLERLGGGDRDVRGGRFVGYISNEDDI
ncbi:hypothetical protein KI688_006359 [Linnemannia hyalina]|uniref:Metal homeostatis protein bsd2 n=1 Tax=Linnemannia hyalina TaxID=64524 RepID=A0A9P7Y380_9FUNG|nr:hypothetical protein KI688_006359 [Linnemannia hyalina]